MKVIAFQAKAALLSKEGDPSFFRMFFGLKSRIFITAEFILRHESPSETCLKGSTFPSPMWIFVCGLVGET
jgi:hypothetical protein